MGSTPRCNWRKYADIVTADAPPGLRGWDRVALENAIATACRIKADVVEKDEREGGLRRVLNLGHTIGHALEAETRYRRFTHGEAVGWGLVGAAWIARHRGLLPEAAYDAVASAVDHVGPRPRVSDVPAPRLLDALARDKKAKDGKVPFVLPTAIGRVAIRNDVTRAEILRALRVMAGREANHSTNETGLTDGPMSASPQETIPVEGPEDPFNWVMQGKERPAPSGAEFKQALDADFNRNVEAVKQLPIKVFQGMRTFIEGMSQLKPGDSLEDHPELVDTAIQISSGLLGAGLATAPFKSGLGMFGGRMSKEAVKTAEVLEKQGMSEVGIKEWTGLERGADKKWRLEFSDAEAKLKPRPIFHKEGVMKSGPKWRATYLSELLKHDKLFEAYPEFSTLNVMNLINFLADCLKLQVVIL